MRQLQRQADSQKNGVIEMKKTVVYEGTSMFEMWEGDTLTDTRTGKKIFLCLPQEIRLTTGSEKNIDRSVKRLKVTIEYDDVDIPKRCVDCPGYAFEDSACGLDHERRRVDSYRTIPKWCPGMGCEGLI